VTNLDKETTAPIDALNEMASILKQYYNSEKCTVNGRSIGIELSYVDLDVVLTAAPTEVEKKTVKSLSVRSEESLEDVDDWRLNEYWLPLDQRESAGAQSWLNKAAKEAEWKSEPLWIPDRDAQCWQPTDPLTQIQRTRDKNKLTKSYYINVVKALKWWKRVNHPEPKYPKGYPLEHIIFHCCPDDITSIADGITRTLEGIQTRFAWQAQIGQTPDLKDHGVDQNVLHRIDPDDFYKFYQQTKEAAKLAREAFELLSAAESAEAWRRLLGSEFPKGPEPEDGSGGDKGGGTIGGFSERRERSLPRDTRFA
jgi:hypothetical protein